MAAMFRKYGLLCLVLAAIAILQILPGHQAFDDAYITYRYAQNLSMGRGFTYNPGEKVLGTTTPLYTLILAGLGTILSIQDFPTISLFINSIADVASVLLLFTIVHELKYPKIIASITSLAYLFNPIRIGVSRGGMETALVVALMLASLYFFVVRKNYPFAALFAAIAFLARPDTLLLPILYSVYSILWLRKFPGRELVLFLIITGPWLLFSSYYFGSLIPNSIIAKSNVYLLHPLQAASTMLGYFATRSPLRNPGWPIWIVGISLLLNLWFFAIGSISMIKRNSLSWVVLLFPMCYSLGLMIANPLLFIWYFPPLLVLFNSLIIIGIYELASRINPPLSSIVSILVVSLMLITEWRVLDQPRDDLSANLRDHEELYEVIAGSLKDEIAPGSTLAMPEIGVLGYSFPESKIIDTVGIISPEAIQYQYRTPQDEQQFSYAIPTDLILDLKPDYLLSLDIFFHPTMLTSQAFIHQYKVISLIPTNAMGSNAFIVFKHVEEGVK